MESYVKSQLDFAWCI